jgi:hypothetical protein
VLRGRGIPEPLGWADRTPNVRAASLLATAGWLSHVADVGATVPAFEWVVGGLWAVGAGLGVTGVALTAGALVRRKAAGAQ